MFGIELDTVKKVEIGFCALVLALAGYFAFANTRPQPDPNVAAWVEPHQVGENGRPAGPQNPVDLKKSHKLWVFANHEGRLEIAEYGAEAGIKAVVSYQPDTRRDGLGRWGLEWKRVEKINDPCKRTLTFAAYSATQGRPLGFLGYARMDKDQLAKEKEARQAMLDQVVLVDEYVKQNQIDAAMYDKVMAALEAFRPDAGSDLSKNPAAARAAAKVMDLGMQYFQKIQASKQKAVDTYVAGIYELLNADQRDKIVKAGQEFASRTIPGKRHPGRVAG